MNDPYSISIHFGFLVPFPNSREDRRWAWKGKEPPTRRDLLEELLAEWVCNTHANIDSISVEVVKNKYDADGECEWETIHDKTVNATSLKASRELLEAEKQEATR